MGDGFGGAGDVEVVWNVVDRDFGIAVTEDLEIALLRYA